MGIIIYNTYIWEITYIIILPKINHRKLISILKLMKTNIWNIRDNYKLEAYKIELKSLIYPMENV